MSILHYLFAFFFSDENILTYNDPYDDHIPNVLFPEFVLESIKNYGDAISCVSILISFIVIKPWI